MVDWIANDINQSEWTLLASLLSVSLWEPQLIHLPTPVSQSSFTQMSAWILDRPSCNANTSLDLAYGTRARRMFTNLISKM